MDYFSTQLRTFGKLRINEPLAKHTTFKIGGPARYFLTVLTQKNLVSALEFIDEQDVSYMMLGGGSNMLVSDDGYDGVVIKYTDDSYAVDDTTVTVGAGATTVSTANQTIRDGLTGFEWGVGVPGTIGGAVRGNAGATGSEMKDSVQDVAVYRNGEVLTVTKSECDFGYRESIFKHNTDIILSVNLALQKATNKEGRKKALDVIGYRNKTQPKGYASTGCMFKNVQIDKENFPERRKAFELHADTSDPKVRHFLDIGYVSAGWLVQESGCKGKQIGDAQVSEVHGNFIINLGKAQASDILALIDFIKEAVYNRYKINLQEEIQIVN